MNDTSKMSKETAGHALVPTQKGSSQCEPRVPALPGSASPLDPVDEAGIVVAEWRSSLQSMVRACGRISRCWDAFKNDKAARDAFVQQLIEGGVIAESDRSLSKLKKLVMIGKHEEFLLRGEILSFLDDGSYSTVYQLVVLSNSLSQLNGQTKGDEELLSILRNCPGRVTRNFLEDTADSYRLPTPPANDNAKPLREHKKGVSIEPGTREKYDLILLTPQEKDFKMLAADYAEESTLLRSLPLDDMLGDNGAILVATRLRHLPIVTERLLPLCGLKAASRFLFPKAPKCPDVTDIEVYVLAQRGTSRRGGLAAGIWVIQENVHPRQIAAECFPDASRRLHLFALDTGEGWDARVADETWAEPPTLRK